MRTLIYVTKPDPDCLDGIHTLDFQSDAEFDAALIRCQQTAESWNVDAGPIPKFGEAGTPDDPRLTPEEKVAMISALTNQANGA